MIYLILLFTTLFSWAKFDLVYGLQGRSLPTIGAELYAESGYNQLIWGKKEEPKDVLYGLIRPNIGVGTSAVINSVKAEVEIFPVSFVGFTFGRSYVHSNFDFPFFNCEAVTCEGEFVRNYVETRLALGHKGWVALGSYKVDTLRSPDRDVPMADWRHVIVGDPGEEVQIDKKLFVGKSFSNVMVGILAENVQFMGSKERKESYAAVYQVRYGDTNYMFGPGLLHTDRQPMGFVFYFRIHGQPYPSLKLF